MVKYSLRIDSRYDQCQLAHAPVNVTLDGTLIPHIGDQPALDALGIVFSGYLSGDSVPVLAKGVSTKQANGDEISWLSAGLTALTINVPLKSPIPINPIKSIDIEYLNLTFTPETAWAPVTNSNDVIAQLGMCSILFPCVNGGPDILNQFRHSLWFQRRGEPHSERIHHLAEWLVDRWHHYT